MSAAGRRLALGTGLLLHGTGDALSPGGCGPLLLRTGGALGGCWFTGTLLQKAPAAVVLVPVVWLLAAWRVSDSSATPPPLPIVPLGDVYADESDEVDRVEWGPEGVVCIIHPKRVEVPPREVA
ncbi:hypothetical protein ADL06_07725 [Streptomyces sp. NRRL F-6491]|nr:hypothetical protein ADL06_07725 [Streptomyces sp. NRRL F-6491]KOX42306.1 hypothetical protein ADL08_16485 [Streptomyces sp. NRRL F-6492]